MFKLGLFGYLLAFQKSIMQLMSMSSAKLKVRRLLKIYDFGENAATMFTDRIPERFNHLEKGYFKVS